MATVYRAPLCLSCAALMAKGSSTFISPHHYQTRFPNSFLQSLASTGRRRVRTPSTHPSFSSSSKRPRRCPGKVSCVFSDTPEAITVSSWNDSVLCSDVPVLVEFWASWCGPCRMVHRVMDEIADEYAGRIKCFMLNTDEYPQVATDHSIERVPTVLLFKNGEKLESITGTLPKSVYVTAIEKSLAN